MWRLAGRWARGRAEGSIWCLADLATSERPEIAGGVTRSGPMPPLCRGNTTYLKNHDFHACAAGSRRHTVAELHPWRDSGRIACQGPQPFSHTCFPSLLLPTTIYF